MRGDFSRDTFRPAKGYTSVRSQQGRVQTDAEWNEQSDILNHLRHTALTDVIGPCGAPENGGGFEIGVTPAGTDLTVSAGRFYVHGILCESEGFRYSEQPGVDGPPPPELPNQPTGVLVYLDVFQRHMTFLDDAEMRESALGGPDTTSRLKTECRVGLLEVPPGTECPDNPQAWIDLTAPPAGRLRARTRPDDAGADPCIVPPGAGYTRLENQFYRVEVHEGGALGAGNAAATFKWSRENGSVVTEWLAQDAGDPDRLTVADTGRDELLGFAADQWIELLDTPRELAGEPGLLVRIAAVEGDVLVIDPNGQVVDFNDFEAPRKVRRWESAGAVTVEQPAANQGYLRLEGGLEVRFEGGPFRTGDWWWVPARTFVGELAGDIEWPWDDATNQPAALPPEGVDHHYCKLAVVPWDGAAFGQPEDCRPEFPPLTDPRAEGCCTFVVRPGESIQQALDDLPDAGGCVCLKVGDHFIEQPLVLRRPRVTLHGETIGARLIRRGGVHAINVVQAADVTIADLAVRGEVAVQVNAAEELALITGRFASGLHVERCRLFVPPEALLAVGVDLAFSAYAQLQHSEIDGCMVAVLTAACDRFEARANRLLGPVATLEGAAVQGETGILSGEAVGHVIADNEFGSYATAVRLLEAVNAAPADRVRLVSRISGNRIERPSGLDDPASGNPRFAIDVEATGTEIADNRLSLPTPFSGGIQVAGTGAVISTNTITSIVAGNAASLAEAVPVGIRLRHRPGLLASCVRDNQLSGIQDAIDIVECRQVLVADNRITGRRVVVAADDPVVAIRLFECRDCRVSGNRLQDVPVGIFLEDGRDNQLEGNRIVAVQVGCGALAETRLQSRDNRVTGAALGFGGVNLAGLTGLHGDRYENCGYLPLPNVGVGSSITVAGIAGDLHIEGCEVRNTGLSPGSEVVIGGPAIGISGAGILQCRLQDNYVGYDAEILTGTDVEFFGREHRAVWLLGLVEYQIQDDFVIGYGAQLLGNRLLGPGLSALVELPQQPVSQNFNIRFERVQFSDNHVWHWTVLGPDVAGGAGVLIPEDATTVRLGTGSAIVMGNHIKTNSPRASSVDFQGAQSVFVGNVTAAGAVGAADFPAPENNFNRLR